MTKEQEAIEYLKESVLIYKNTIPKISESIETVLSMLKEKDEKIEYYKKQKDYDDQFKHELLEQIRCLNLDKDEKDKIIDLMAERIEWLCKNFGILLDEEHDENFTQEDIKQYFEGQVLNK